MGWYLFRTQALHWQQKGIPWLKTGEVCSDPVRDFKPDKGEVSTWEILPDKSNLNIVIDALAATKDDFEKFGYSLIATSTIDTLGIKPKATTGRSAIESVNKWHRDFEFSASDLGTFITTVYSEMGGNFSQVVRPDIKERLIQRHKGKEFTQLSSKLKATLDAEVAAIA